MFSENIQFKFKLFVHHFVFMVIHHYSMDKDKTLLCQGVNEAVSACEGEVYVVTTKQQRFAGALLEHAGEQMHPTPPISWDIHVFLGIFRLFIGKFHLFIGKFHLFIDNFT